MMLCALASARRPLCSPLSTACCSSRSRFPNRRQTPRRARMPRRSSASSGDSPIPIWPTSGARAARSRWRPGPTAEAPSARPESRSTSTAAQISAELFQVLGIDPYTGADFRPDEDRPARRRSPSSATRCGNAASAARPTPSAGRSCSKAGRTSSIGVAPDGFALDGERRRLHAPRPEHGAAAAESRARGSSTCSRASRQRDASARLQAELAADRPAPGGEYPSSNVGVACCARARCGTRWWATSGRRCGCCSPPSVWFCSWRA